ncbi:hypothetical protein [Paracoccus sp. NBH48]|uniref:hypothetical protein n=1 Tax=Paracoccus sp. NBH48 TaxID=2596918 RepID=UPI002106B3DF|nr:hypothetical protein [Paracoccus sp. NBH48]
MIDGVIGQGAFGGGGRLGLSQGAGLAVGQRHDGLARESQRRLRRVRGFAGGGAQLSHGDVIGGQVHRCRRDRDLLGRRQDLPTGDRIHGQSCMVGQLTARILGGGAGFALDGADDGHARHVARHQLPAPGHQPDHQRHRCDRAHVMGHPRQPRRQAVGLPGVLCLTGSRCRLSVLIVREFALHLVTRENVAAFAEVHHCHVRLPAGCPGLTFACSQPSPAATHSVSAFLPPE